MDLEDRVRENIGAAEYDRRDKGGDFNARFPDWDEINEILDNMSHSDFLCELSRAMEEAKTGDQ